MAFSGTVTSFQYTATSTADITLSGWGFQPTALILTWTGASGTVDAVGAGNIYAGRGFGCGTADQRCAGYTSANGAAVGAGATWHHNSAILSIADDTATVDGTISIKSMDSGGVTFQVDDAISVNLAVEVVALGGSDITNAATGQDQDAGTTGNTSNTSIGFQPDIMFFAACADGNNSPTGGGGSNSESGFEVGVAMSATKQYTMAVLTDDGSANADTGGYIYNGEFLASCQTSNPVNIWARKSLVSMDTNGFTWNQLELAQTAGCYFHFLAIKGGNWDVGDFSTPTDTTTTVTESGLSFAPDLIGFESISKAISTQDTGEAQCNATFGAAMAGVQMAVALQDEDAVSTTETSNAIDYDQCYLNISTADAIQGAGGVTAFNSDGFDFKMTDADPSASYVYWWTVGSPSGVTATGNNTLGSLASTSAATVDISASFAGTLAAGSTSASSTVDIDAAVSKTLEDLAQSSAATVTITGTFAGTLLALVLSSSATVDGTATLAQTLEAITLSGSGTVDISATLGKTLSELLSAGAGVVPVTASSAQTFAALALVASGSVDIDATLSTILEALALSGTGTTSSIIEGVLAQTLADLTSTAAANISVDATLAGLFGDLVSSSSGGVTVVANLLKTLETVVTSASGSVDVDATLSSLLGALVLAASDSGIVTATLAQTLEGVTFTSSGIVSIDGIITKTLEDVASAGSANVTQTGTASQVLGVLASSSSASVSVTGTLSQALSALLLTAAGSATTIVPGHSQRGIVTATIRRNIEAEDDTYTATIRRNIEAEDDTYTATIRRNTSA